jgi:DNA-binding transcriptional regulator YiaG
MSEKEFIRGNDRIDQMLHRPGTAEAVAKLEQHADELDRVHAMSLAMVREAGKHTQAEIARALNVTQGSVSQMERRDDMLLSTLRNYLTATGGGESKDSGDHQWSRHSSGHLTA